MALDNTNYSQPVSDTFIVKLYITLYFYINLKTVLVVIHCYTTAF